MIFAWHTDEWVFADETDPMLLRQWSDASELYCTCGENVTFVDAQVRIKHFRHLPDSSCAYGSDGVSEEHLLAQAEVLKVLHAFGYEAQLERTVSINELRQRADVFAVINGKKWVFEIQRSTQSLYDTLKRTRDYKAKGIDHVVWFFRDLPIGSTPSKSDGLFLYDMASHDIRLGVKHDIRVRLFDFIDEAVKGRVRCVEAKYADQLAQDQSPHKVRVQVKTVKESKTTVDTKTDGDFEISEGECHQCKTRAYTYVYHVDANYEPYVQSEIMPLLQDIQSTFEQLARQSNLPVLAIPRNYKAENSFNLAQGCPNCKVGSIRPHLTRYTGRAKITAQGEEAHTEYYTYDIEQPPRIISIEVSAQHWCIVNENGACLCEV